MYEFWSLKTGLFNVYYFRKLLQRIFHYHGEKPRNFSLIASLGSLSNDDGAGRQRERYKSNRFRFLAKQQLCTYITLFCTFLCSHCTTTTWKCLITFCRGRGHKATTFFLASCSELRYSLLELTKRNAKIWRVKPGRINAIKLEAARLHDFSDVFVAVAFVLA